MIAPFTMRDFRMYTYSPPAIYLEPMMVFIRQICTLCAARTLPISVSSNDSPRESRFGEDQWERFLGRTRKGLTKTCTICQYTRDDMTAHSFLPLDRPLPLEIEAQFVPAGGIPLDLRSTSLAAFVELGERYPTNLAVRLQVAEYTAPDGTGLAGYLHSLETGLTASSSAAHAHVDCFAWMPFQEYPLEFPRGVGGYSRIENLAMLIPHVSWGMFLGPKHIARLGGKARLFDALSDCRVDDLSTETGDRIYIQLTDDIEEFSDEVGAKYRPFFEPLLSTD